MNIVLWVIAGVLGLAFLAAGAMKVSMPRAKLEENMSWVKSASDSKVKGIGALEILGAIGIILPGALGIVPILTPLAALGLLALMIGAAVTHFQLGEGIAGAAPAIVLAILAAVVAWGRFGPYSF